MSTALVWIRNDLRLHDHEPLRYAADNYDRVVPVYCFDPRHFATTMFDLPKTGAVRARFLRESVEDLRSSLRDRGSDLVVRHGRPETVLATLVRKTGAQTVHQFQEIGTEERAVEEAVRESLANTGVEPGYFWGKTLYHPKDLPFAEAADIPDVYKNFRKGVEKQSRVRAVIDAPASVPPLPDAVDPGSCPTLEDLGIDENGIVDDRSLLPFKGGETRGLDRIDEYIWREDCLKKYKATRNGLLGANYSSKFSPWLAHGCISPRQIYEEVQRYEEERISNKSTYWMKFELIWRDFHTFTARKAGPLLFASGGPAGKTPDWQDSSEAFERWTKGKTGIPFVDANMRELNRTAFMSNRGRQNVASMLSMSLRQDWRKGAAYFESRLVDYDVCSNWGNWAYNSGVGHDPRDRYFNIVKQANRYDPDGEYVRYWLPELEGVPDEYVHEPHRMSRGEQEATGCVLGQDYPEPMVNLEKTYERVRRIRDKSG